MHGFSFIKYFIFSSVLETLTNRISQVFYTNIHAHHHFNISKLLTTFCYVTVLTAIRHYISISKSHFRSTYTCICDSYFIRGTKTLNNEISIENLSNYTIVIHVIQEFKINYKLDVSQKCFRKFQSQCTKVNLDYYMLR